MEGTILEMVQEEKDLGVFITTDLKAAKQCNQAYYTATRMLGIINRTTGNISGHIIESTRLWYDHWWSTVLWRDLQGT